MILRMHTLRWVSVTFSAGWLLFGALPTRAQQDDQPYLNLDAGMSLALTQGARNLENRSETADLHYDPGYRVSLSFGYFLRNGGVFSYSGGYGLFNLGLEIETGVIWNRAKSDSELAKISFEDLELYRFPVMLNVAFDVPIITERLHLNLSAGAGGLISLAQSQRSDLGAGSDVEFTFAWQAGARLGYDVTPHLTVGAFYKLLRLVETDFGGDVQLSLDGDYAQAMGVFVTWKF